MNLSESLNVLPHQGLPGFFKPIGLMQSKLSVSLFILDDFMKQHHDDFKKVEII